MTRSRRKTETAKRMTRMRTGRGSSLELGPPVVGTMGALVTTDSEIRKKIFSISSLKL